MAEYSRLQHGNYFKPEDNVPVRTGIFTICSSCYKNVVCSDGIESIAHITHIFLQIHVLVLRVGQCVSLWIFVLT